MEDIGSAMGIQSYRGQGYEGAIVGKCLASSRRFHLYVMDMLLGRVSCAPDGCVRRPPADGRPADTLGMGPGVHGGYPL